MGNDRTETSSKRRFVRGMGIAVFGLAAFGFLYKFFEFANSIFSAEILNFAVVPVVVYLIVGLGFFCLFLWSILKGHLRDIEAPKYRMLELDEEGERDARLARMLRLQKQAERQQHRS